MPTSYISRIFGRSPVKPMQEHMHKVNACVAALISFIEAMIKSDQAAALAARDLVVAFEDEADDLKHEIRLHLPSGLFMPVSRRDLLELLRMQDKIANLSKDISGLMTGRKMQLPEAIAADYLKFVKRCGDACIQAEATINELDELLETSFGLHEVERVMKMLHELDDIEKSTDKLQIKVRADLFAIEKDLPPIDVMFLYDIIDRTGGLADCAQRVGSRLMLLLAR